MRRDISTHTPSEKRVGYSRAVVIDDSRIYFSGTTSQNAQGEVVGSDVYSQTKNILSNIAEILELENFSLQDTVLFRAYLVDMKQLEGFDTAFSEHFQNSKPACTLVGIAQLVDPKMLIEIECIAERSIK